MSDMDRAKSDIATSIRKALSGSPDSWEGTIRKVRRVMRQSPQFCNWEKSDPILQGFLRSDNDDIVSLWSGGRKSKKGVIHVNIFKELDSPSKLFSLRARMARKSGRKLEELPATQSRWIVMDDYFCQVGAFVLAHVNFYSENGTYECYIDYSNSLVLWAYLWSAEKR